LWDFSGAVVARLADEHKTEVHVHDPSGEVFWTWWPSPEQTGCGQLMLLNTNWAEPGTAHEVTVHTPAMSSCFSVREGEASILTVLPFAIVRPRTPELHVEVVSLGRNSAQLCLHGSGNKEIVVYDASKSSETLSPDHNSSTKVFVNVAVD
jgi:hypothetical protein